MTPEQLRAERLRLGLTQHGMALALGVHPNTLARWERGELVPAPYLWRAVRDLSWELRNPE